MKDLVQILVCTGIVAIPFAVIGGAWWNAVDWWKKVTAR